MKNFFLVLLAALSISSVSGCATANQVKPTAREQELQSRVSSLEEELKAKDDEIRMIQDSANVDTSSSSAASCAKVKPTNKRIQAALKNAGYYKGKVDGKVGKNTRKAIIAFQKANGLKGDGVVGNRTWEMLKQHI